MSQDNTQYPFPELLRLGRGGKWDIAGSDSRKRAHVAPADRQILVPLDSTRESRGIRAHELGHAQWSPAVQVSAIESETGIPAILIQAVEDARINLNLGRSGVDISDGLADTATLATIANKASGMLHEEDIEGALAFATAALVSCIGIEKDYRRLSSHFKTLKLGVAAERAAKVRALMEESPGYIPFRKTLQASQYMLIMTEEEEEEPEQLQIPMEADKHGEGEGDASSGESDAKPAGKPRETKPEDPTPPASPEDKSIKRPPEKPAPSKGAYKEKKETPEQEASRKRKDRVTKRKAVFSSLSKKTETTKGSFHDSDPLRQMIGYPPAKEARKPRWGRMTIETPPLPRKYRELFGKKAKSDSDFGLDLLHVERAYEDGHIFRTVSAGKRKGGSVLLDCSGSMGLSDEMIRKIIKALPLSIIALYGGGERESGTLRIIARKGSMIDLKAMKAPGLGYNIIDGPALEWLSKQQQPRYWYSDGYVTGVDESRDSALMDDAQNIVLRSSIRRVTKIEQITTSKTWTNKVPFSYRNRAYDGHSEAFDFDTE